MDNVKKFTPGPWLLDDRYGEEALFSKSNGQAVAYAAWRGGSKFDLAFNSKEDAHLIIAAPELYEALEKLDSAGRTAWHFQHQDTNAQIAFSTALTKARAALAKARGDA